MRRQVVQGIEREMKARDVLGVSIKYLRPTPHVRFPSHSALSGAFLGRGSIIYGHAQLFAVKRDVHRHRVMLQEELAIMQTEVAGAEDAAREAARMAEVQRAALPRVKMEEDTVAADARFLLFESDDSRE